MTRAMRSAAVAAMILVAATAHAQSADEIAEKHIAAAGGREALRAILSRKALGTITASTPAGEVTGPIEIYNVAPNKQRIYIRLDLSSFNLGEMTIDQRFDGASGYVIDTMQGDREITGDQLEGLKNTHFPNALLNYKERGITLEAGGRERLSDRDAFVLIARPPSGPAVRMLIDTESGLMLRQIVQFDAPGLGPIEQVSDFLDYRLLDGVAVAAEVRNTTPVQTTHVRLTSVEHNTAIDPSLFANPAN